MTTLRFFDRYQTGREDFIRLHRRAIRTGLLGAAAVFCALRALHDPAIACLDGAGGLVLLLFAPLFLLASWWPSLAPPVFLAMGALALNLLAPGLFPPELGRGVEGVDIVPALGAYAAHLWYMWSHPLWVTGPRDRDAYAAGYLGIMEGENTARRPAEAEAEEEEYRSLDWRWERCPTERSSDWFWERSPIERQLDEELDNRNGEYRWL